MWILQQPLIAPASFELMQLSPQKNDCFSHRLEQKLNELVRDAPYPMGINIGLEYYLFDHWIVTFLTIIIYTTGLRFLNISILLMYSNNRTSFDTSVYYTDGVILYNYYYYYYYCCCCCCCCYYYYYYYYYLFDQIVFSVNNIGGASTFEFGGFCFLVSYSTHVAIKNYSTTVCKKCITT